MHPHHPIFLERCCTPTDKVEQGCEIVFVTMCKLSPHVFKSRRVAVDLPRSIGHVEIQRDAASKTVRLCSMHERPPAQIRSQRQSSLLTMQDYRAYASYFMVIYGRPPTSAQVPFPQLRMSLSRGTTTKQHRKRPRHCWVFSEPLAFMNSCEMFYAVYSTLSKPSSPLYMGVTHMS